MMSDVLGRALDHALTATARSPAVDDLRGGRLSGAGLRAGAHKVAARLEHLGARRVALLADNGIPWLLADLAAHLAGVSLVPLPPFFSDEQLEHVVREADPDLILTDRPSLLADLGSLSTVDGRSPEGLAWLSRPSRGEPVPRDELVSFTSGSTGRPKGARLPASALLAVARSLGHATGVRDDDVHLASLPLPVLLETVGGVYRPLLAGGCVLLPDLRRLGTAGGCGIDGAVLARLVREQRATSAVLVPQTLEALLDAWPTVGSPRHGLRFLGVGGAATPPSLLHRADDLRLPVFEGYGLTECASVVCLNTAQARRVGSVGRPLPHARVELAPDGELRIGGALMRGYLHEQGEQPRRLATGDLGRVDAEGFVFLHGRKGNRFSTAFGRNLSPEWIETRLLELPGIRQAVVLGDGLPAPVAVLVLDHPGAEPDLAAVNRELPAYARLSGWLAAPEPFTPANGQWTNTGRPKRDAIAAAFTPFLPMARPLAEPAAAHTP